MGSKITAETVKSAEPRTKRYIIWDAGDGSIKGFGLRVMPSGCRTFFFQYRMPGGRRAKVERCTIGKAGPGLTATIARARAVELREQVARGVNPVAQVRATLDREDAAKAAAALVKNNRAEVLADSYIETLRKRTKPLRSLTQIERLFRHDVVGTPEEPGPWRGKDATRIKRCDVLDLLQGVIDRPAPYLAKQVLSAVRPFFRHVMNKTGRDDNPALEIRLKDLGVAPVPRERHLTSDELCKVWIAANKMPYPWGPFMRLLILTGQRREEVAGIHLSELSGDTWTIPEARAKNRTAHIVHLGSQSIQALADAQRDCGSNFASGYFFTTNGRTSVSGFSKAKADLDTLSGVANWRLHDLRRTFATLSADVLNVDERLLDRALSHKRTILEGTYQKAAHLAARRAALIAWGDYVASLDGENVVRLHVA